MLCCGSVTSYVMWCIVVVLVGLLWVVYLFCFGFLLVLFGGFCGRVGPGLILSPCMSLSRFGPCTCSSVASGCYVDFMYRLNCVFNSFRGQFSCFGSLFTILLTCIFLVCD